MERISIDIAKYQLLQEPGLKHPSLRLTYASPELQEVVHYAFGRLLPSIHFDGDGRPYYELLDDAGEDCCCRSRAAARIEEIPPEELFYLDNGLNTMRLLADQGQLPIGVTRMIAEFQLPDPETELGRYRIYTDGTGSPRLLVLWGFSANRRKGLPMPAITAVNLLKARVDTSEIRMEAEAMGGLASDSGESIAAGPADAVKNAMGRFWNGMFGKK